MPTTTIVFRGLMVFNYQRDYMEIGFINALPPPVDHEGGHPPGGEHEDHVPLHIPRILTMKDGLLASVFDFRTRGELDKVRNWEIEVTNPLPGNATIFTEGDDFDRLADPEPNPRDFRWITDLEARDLHGRNLGSELDTRQLLLVLYVRHGDFSTRMRSPVLKRTRVNPPEQEITFGRVAAVTACEIKFETGQVRLVAGGSGGPVVFTFFPVQEGADPATSTIYEISNSPPDVSADGPMEETGHFHVYYDKLFNRKPNDQFDLEKDDEQPSPDPALCGATLLGERDDPL